jgi:hypothetical protein
MAFVKAQDSYGFLDGSTQPPAQTIPNPSTTQGAPATIANPKFLAWCQRDQMLLSVLISTLSEPLVVHTVGCATSHQLWTTLVSMFASQARSRVLQIHYQLATSKKGSASITEYFQSFKALCDNLAAAGQHLNDFERTPYFLAGLRSDYDLFITSITTRLDPLSLDEIYGHLLAHEMRIEHHLTPVEPVSPATNFSSRGAPSRGRGYCGRGYNTNNYQGWGSAYPGRGRGTYFPSDSAQSSRPICQLCGKIEHTAPRCYQHPDPALVGPPSAPYQLAQAYYSSLVFLQNKIGTRILVQPTTSPTTCRT